ncbi:MAG: hypothetical protein PHY12_06850, partial [Eubacteriales bacterium]|nr:hypothetical protein [Eubacteriales bacterium]
MLRWIQNSRGYLLRHAAYEAQLCLSEGPMRVELAFDGREMAELALVSVLDTPDEKERLTDVAIQRLDEEGDALTLLLTARSSLWQSRRFEWRFEQGRVTYRHFASGDAPLGRCFFFSNGQPGIYDPGDSVGGYHANASFLTPVYHTFNPNLANVTEFDISQPGFAGVGRSEAVRHADYVNIERHNGIFSPGPLCFAFRHADAVMGLGLGCKPGAYQFNGLEYSGCMKYAASFHVQYLGYTRVSGGYESPEIALTFGYSPFECLTRYIGWIDERGYGTSFRFPAAPWHRQPIFCGWAEQSALCPPTSTPAAQATQANYEAWAAELDARGVPYGTLVVDDKWQKHYGTFEVDREKWPDMPGFVRRQHEKGRHVLLWIPGYQAEGVPEAFCAKDESGKPLFATPGLPAYDAFI